MDFNDIFKYNIQLFGTVGKLKTAYNFCFNHYLFSVIKKNKMLYNDNNSSKKCYVLALGPSLKSVDLNRINGDTIVVNRFYKIGVEYPEFVPTYYMMIDNAFYDERAREELTNALDLYLERGTIFLLNSKISKYDFIKKYDHNKIFYISCFGGNVNPQSYYKIDGILPAFMNVVGCAIMSIMTMGYKKLTLLGCDFNSFASQKVVHCYKDDSEERTLRLSYELFAYSYAAQSHESLSEYAKEHGINIINSTPGSLIDAYERNVEKELFKR